MTHPAVMMCPVAKITPPAIEQSVPIVVMVFGLTRLRTKKSANGSMIRRYPRWIASHRIFMPRG